MRRQEGRRGAASRVLALCTLAGVTQSFHLAAPRWNNPAQRAYPLPSTATPITVLDSLITELPDTFDDAVRLMGEGSQLALREGVRRMRIDFDTSVGDETYTMLKNSLGFSRSYVEILAQECIGDAPASEDGSSAAEQQRKTLRVFFPDAGSAALAERDWRDPGKARVLPPSIKLANVARDKPQETDAGCVILCPRNSEADDVVRLVREVAALDQFCVLINPELVNMGTTGYGLAGRRMREDVLSTFRTVYYLRTLPWGAVTRFHGRRYSIWQEDAAAAGGFRCIRSTEERPSGPDLEDIYDIENGLATEQSTPKFLDGIADFVRDFGRL